MNENNCLQTISNLTEECAFAYFDRKVRLENELSDTAQSKSFAVSCFVILSFISLVFCVAMKNNTIIYCGAVVYVIAILLIAFFFKKHYSKSKKLKELLSINTLKRSILLTDNGINTLLDERDWSENELYIIGRSLKANIFNYADVLEIRESVVSRFYHEDKLKEWEANKNQIGNITDISQMTRLKQMRKFEKLLKTKGYKMAV